MLVERWIDVVLTLTLFDQTRFTVGIEHHTHFTGHPTYQSSNHQLMRRQGKGHFGIIVALTRVHLDGVLVLLQYVLGTTIRGEVTQVVQELEHTGFGGIEDNVTNTTGAIGGFDQYVIG
ncbi:hypothetical protein D3C85_1376710 [compost metagenome]